ncbi:hypothetical protein Bhyg_15101, partial [Pseudolycoriella hygida]
LNETVRFDCAFSTMAVLVSYPKSKVVEMETETTNIKKSSTSSSSVGVTAATGVTAETTGSTAATTGATAAVAASCCLGRAAFFRTYFIARFSR